MTLRSLVAMAALAVPSAACSGAQVLVESVNVDGRERFRELQTENAKDAMTRAALAYRASRDLGCPAADVRVAERASTEVYAVEACGKHAVYLLVGRAGIAEQVPGFEGQRALLWMRRFVLLSEGDGRSSREPTRSRDAYVVRGAGELCWPDPLSAPASMTSGPHEHGLAAPDRLSRSSPAPWSQLACPSSPASPSSPSR